MMQIQAIAIIFWHLFIVSDAAYPIYLLGLYPLTGDWAGGQAMLPASQMAVLDINANTSILADYELHIIVTDTKVGDSHRIERFLNRISTIIDNLRSL